MNVPLHDLYNRYIPRFRILALVFLVLGLVVLVVTYVGHMPIKGSVIGVVMTGFYVLFFACLIIVMLFEIVYSVKLAKIKRECHARKDDELNRPTDTLITRINRNGDVNDPETPRPLLTLEEFFTKNNDYGSIGCNLPNQPAPRSFYILFKKIRERPDVADVLVEVSSHDDLDMWPFADTVWIITSALLDEVKDWFPEKYSGDDYIEGFPANRPMEQYAIPHGMRAVGVWWD